MELQCVHLGNFKLDGGAMFGVVPKVLWEKKVPADKHNLCTWSMRSLLIKEGDRLILIDTGLGDKQSDKFYSYYYPENLKNPDEAVRELGYHPDEITDVFLTHLHFDHVGGAVKYDKNRKLIPTFKNATYWSEKNHWEWANNPNPREKASFLEENIVPLQESEQLEFIDPQQRSKDGLPFDILFMDGHTEKQMLPVINYKEKSIVYVADLLPSMAHIPLAWVMGYDVRPLQTMKEKERFLRDAVAKDYILFFEHDASNECGTLENTEKGIRGMDTFRLKDI